MAYYINDERAKDYEKDVGEIDGSLDWPTLRTKLRCGRTTFMFKHASFENAGFKLVRSGNQLLLDFKIYDIMGREVAYMVNNQWKKKLANYERNFTDRAVEIIDDQQRVIVQAEYDGEALHLFGIFRDSTGQGMTLSPDKDGSCLMGFLTQNEEHKALGTIPRMFMYPAELNPGKKEKNN